MRGNFDVNEELYPCRVTLAGVNDVVIVNALNGQELAREEAAPAGTAERSAQWERLADQAREANRAIRANAVLPAGEHKPLGHVTDGDVSGD